MYCSWVRCGIKYRVKTTLTDLKETFELKENPEANYVLYMETQSMIFNEINNYNSFTCLVFVLLLVAIFCVCADITSTSNDGL